MPIPATVDAPEVNKTDAHPRSRRLARAVLIGALLAGALALSPPAGAAASATGATSANFSVRSLCSVHARGRAGCLALGLHPRRASAVPGARPRGGVRAAAENISAPWPQSFSPLQVQKAYALPFTPPSPQTIAIVDAYDDAHIAADLAVYSEQFLGASAGPPACTIAAGKVGDPVGGSLAEGCFLKVDQQGSILPEGPRSESEPPTSEGELAQGWAGEIATDVELAHGLCESCRIVLVEASSDEYQSFEAAENEAAALGADEISNSWGGEAPESDRPAFNHPGVVITASAGDSGYLNWTEAGSEAYFEGVDYPASSPHVVAVGGTFLKLSAAAWQSETVWNEAENNSGASGGGCSSLLAAPPWQEASSGWSAVGCAGKRAVADVAADGDPYSGVAVYDSTPDPSLEGDTGWSMIGGTSVASPIIASTFALAGGAGGVQYPAQTLYSHAGSAALHDVTAGGNGECKGSYSSGCSGSLASPLDCGSVNTICDAAVGYDGPTGVGSPNGVAAFQSGSEEPGKGKGSEEGGGPGGEKGKSEEGGSGSKGSAGEAGPAGGGSPTGAGGSPGAGATTEPLDEVSDGEEEESSPSAVSAGSIRLSNLALTFSAIAALNSGRPRVSEVAFTFTLNAPARVRVVLARRARVRGHWRWSPQPGSFTLAVPQGRNQARLRSHHALRPGRYRLALAPAHGVGQSLTIVIG
jgi:hypothetical protein